MADKLGDLYVVATPIGNLADMVPRAIDVLQQVDFIAAEDTRHSGRLLSHFGITTPTLSYHDHSGGRQTEKLLAVLLTGKSVALISDAGTPLISDPGFRLVREARQQGIQVTPIPGACAAIVALSASGLPSDRFTFEGFLPAKSGQRQKALDALAAETRTLVFYEAPHRVLATLQDMVLVLGADREVVLAREITKAHETFLVGTLAELVSRVAADSNQQRGEIVLIIRGAQHQALTGTDAEQQRVLGLLLEEVPLKKAAALTAQITGGNKKNLYQLGIELKGKER